MKKTIIAALVMSSVSFANAETTTDLTSKEQKLGYGIGAAVGGNVAQTFNETDIDIDAFIAGFKDIFQDNEPQMSQEEVQQVIQAFQQEKMAQVQAEQAQLAEEQKAKSDAWLAEKEAEEGVEKTESGLLYKVVTQGDGDKPAAEDTVKVHYAGTLIDGTEFDSSYKRGEPISFPLNQVIPGWTEGLQLMSVGSKYELYIPSDLAYGPGGTGPIPANSALKFVVELLDIEKAEIPAEETKAE
ncbi:FKBP-type peptidyl-prolyl cis-trans isomerase [Marinomonas balearica]|uniref:Peptidyl-prolyl cis-trans isomerase n=1 Tax=Marinomonas balearica TaxID=491947 RepID=A0A4V3CG20_9GAMM|nr:FKBP-type peptidyl-prolyl cis-trans isomerase [Marinomonas balearica]TDO96002.1 FKBP-type peptidyl-prolyl cis-trans isomerase FkpA/FKBP-type peptidyl-prolyl cis-trans isomerase FklB [Marinomonas balearica]